MEALWTTAVAVVGTLLGSVVTHLFQRQALRRNEQFTRSEALRRELTEVYGQFAAALEEYRRGQAERWYLLLEDRRSERYLTVRDEAHGLRTAARQSMYRVKLLTEDRAVVEAAEQAYTAVRDLADAGNQRDRDSRDQAARTAIEGFLTAAAPLVR